MARKKKMFRGSGTRVSFGRSRIYDATRGKSRETLREEVDPPESLAIASARGKKRKARDIINNHVVVDGLPEFDNGGNDVLFSILKAIARTRALSNLSDAITSLIRAEGLILEEAWIASLPSWIGSLSNLNEFSLQYTANLRALPHEIGNLSSLQLLNLANSGIESLPTSIGKLANLQELRLENTAKLQGLPDEIGNLTKLKVLRLENSHIESLPTSIGNLAQLEELNLDFTEKLLGIPDEIGNLKNLKGLSIKFSTTASLPPSIGNLKNLERVYLAGPYVSKAPFPDILFGLSNLKILSLRFESMYRLCDAFGNLTKLECLDLDNIESIPKSIGNLSNLKQLSCVSVDGFETLPDEVGNLTLLEAFDLIGTSISSIPTSIICNLKNLEVLHLNGRLLHYDHHKDIQEIFQHCPRLGCLGNTRLMNLTFPVTLPLKYSLIRNRIRSRIFSPQRTQQKTSPPLSLWPRILEAVERAALHEHRHSMCCGCSSFHGLLTQADLIFRLLVDHGKDFVSDKSQNITLSQCHNCTRRIV